MKKITLLIILMISSLGFAQPTTSAPVPTKLPADVISIYGAGYTSIGTDYNPNWGQSGGVNVAYNPGDGNLCMAYTNFNYQGTNLTTTNASAMEYIHIDIWTSTATVVKVSPINNGTGVGEFLVNVPLVQGGWSSVDIPKSSFTGMTWNSVFQIKFDGQAGANPSTIYLDNIYFWKAPVAAGTPNIGALTVPAKNLGDASFDLTDPTSDSSGSFTYTSSNTAVATISGKTVTILGAGTSTITANQAASAPFIAGSVTADLVVTAIPLTPAPTPPNRNPSDVFSIYSDKYTNVTSNFDAGWCGPGSVSQIMIAGNATESFLGNNCQGIDFNSNRIDASLFTNLHIDFYTTETNLVGKVFNLKLVDFGPSGTVEMHNVQVNINGGSTPAIISNGWVSVDVPVNLSGFTGLAQAAITSNLNNTVWYDNYYLYKGTALATASFEKSSIKLYPNPATSNLTIQANSAIDKVSVYNILGQEVIAKSPKSNDVTLDISNLQKGAYIVKTTSDGKTDTTKILKK